jgi:hypothetical protein
MDKPLRIKGHKLEHSRSGVNDAYARGRCDCGWVFKGWTHYRSSVQFSYRQHLEVVKMRAEKAAIAGSQA